jgi:hypothetical protein
MNETAEIDALRAELENAKDEVRQYRADAPDDTQWAGMVRRACSAEEKIVALRAELAALEAMYAAERRHIERCAEALQRWEDEDGAAADVRDCIAWLATASPAVIVAAGSGEAGDVLDALLDAGFNGDDARATIIDRGELVAWAKRPANVWDHGAWREWWNDMPPALRALL